MENKDIRRGNLQALLDEHLKTSNATKASFAESCGISAAQLSQMLGENSVRNVGDKMARKIEAHLSLPNGWMDTLQSNSTPKADLEYVGKVASGNIPVVGEAILGVDGMIHMEEHRAGWLQIYSSDRDAYALKVKGDSMHPRIQSGEFVVIEPNTQVHPSDEVFVRTKDGHNMIKIMTKTRDGSYQFSSVNNDHKPITLEPYEVEKIQYVAAIVKATRYIDNDEFPPRVINGLNIFP